MSKKIIINEEQYKKLVLLMKEDCCSQYSYSPENVLIVKKYLDNNFKRGSLEQIGDNGLPTNIQIVAIINPQTGNVAQNMYDHQLLELLIEQFKNMFVDAIERERFLTQVMKDWYYNKISPYGSLSVNFV